MLRFWSKVKKSRTSPSERPDLGPCWEWTGARNRDGYGAFQCGHSTTIGAHRVAYEMTKGPIPQGLHLDHLCRVRHCVNPVHLEAVTPRENTLRGDTITARNLAKSVCPQGHPYDALNVRGARRCRRCMTATNERSYAKRKARAHGALA